MHKRWIGSNTPFKNTSSPKAFLFDTTSKLYVATDASPVDQATHNLCCDYLQMLNAFRPLYKYGRPSSKPTHLADPHQVQRAATSTGTTRHNSFFPSNRLLRFFQAEYEYQSPILSLRIDISITLSTRHSHLPPRHASLGSRRLVAHARVRNEKGPRGMERCVVQTRCERNLGGRKRAERGRVGRMNSMRI